MGSMNRCWKNALRSRKQKYNDERIICNDLETIELINSWVEGEGWSFENFADFVELIGIKTPVTVSKFSAWMIELKTADNKVLHVDLLFGDGFDRLSEIHINYNCITKGYTINSYNKRNKNKPKVNLSWKRIEAEDKDIFYSYTDSGYFARINFDKSHQLRITFNCRYGKFEESKLRLLIENDEIEKFIIGLDDKLKINEVYEKYMNALNLSSAELEHYIEIYFSYSMANKLGEKVNVDIKVENGKLVEYSIHEEEKFLSINENGNWQCIFNNGLRIAYSKEMDLYDISCIASETDFLAIDYSSSFAEAKRRIENLKIDFFKH